MAFSRKVSLSVSPYIYIIQGGERNACYSVRKRILLSVMYMTILSVSCITCLSISVIPRTVLHLVLGDKKEKGEEGGEGGGEEEETWRNCPELA